MSPGNELMSSRSALTVTADEVRKAFSSAARDRLRGRIADGGSRGLRRRRVDDAP